MKQIKSEVLHPVVIYLHGGMGTRVFGHRRELYQILQNNEYHVVALDYRGYADSTSEFPTSETGFVTDALAIYQWVLNNTNPETPIFIWGHSLGTG